MFLRFKKWLARKLVLDIVVVKFDGRSPFHLIVDIDDNWESVTTCGWRRTKRRYHLNYYTHTVLDKKKMVRGKWKVLKNLASNTLELNVRAKKPDGDFC